jgi:hypothetical protein
LNSGFNKYGEAITYEMYVDKTGMITYLNKIVRPEQKYVSVSRPRCFDKSIVDNMLATYFGWGDSGKLLWDYHFDRVIKKSP